MSRERLFPDSVYNLRKGETEAQLAVKGTK